MRQAARLVWREEHVDVDADKLSTCAHGSSVGQRRGSAPAKHA